MFGGWQRSSSYFSLLWPENTKWLWDKDLLVSGPREVATKSQQQMTEQQVPTRTTLSIDSDSEAKYWLSRVKDRTMDPDQ